MKRLLLVGLMLVAGAASAVTSKDYSETEFNNLMAAGSPILVDINATWCGTCKKQGMVIDDYLAENADSDLTVLKVDFDSEKETVKKFKAVKQSTLIVFDDGKEVDRVLAQTNKESLYALFGKVE